MGLFGRFFGPKVRWVHPRDAHALVQDGAQLVDVRRRAERRQARPVDSIHLPLHLLPRQTGRLDPERPVVCICASGARSATAARHLAREGFEAHNVRGGMAAWQRAGLPVEA